MAGGTNMNKVLCIKYVCMYVCMCFGASLLTPSAYAAGSEFTVQLIDQSDGKSIKIPEGTTISLRSDDKCSMISQIVPVSIDGVVKPGFSPAVCASFLNLPGCSWEYYRGEKTTMIFKCSKSSPDPTFMTATTK